MAPQHASIDSFLLSKPLTPHPALSARPIGDGFSTEEIDRVLHPQPNTDWQPAKHYEEVDIGDIDSGPGCIMIQGRIANILHQPNVNKKPKAAKGCIKVIVKDDTGAISVRDILLSDVSSLIIHIRYVSGSPTWNIISDLAI